MYLNFLTALLELPTPNTGGTIQLDYNFPSAPLPPTIFVTQAYINLSQILCTELMNEDAEKRSFGLIITGTPGVGKSCFIPFLMMYLVAQSLSVAVEYQSIFYHYDVKTKCCTVVNPFDINFDRRTYVDTVFISDLSDASFSLYSRLSFYCRAVFVSSPDPTKLRIVKSFRSRVKYYMPSWTSTELIECRRTILSSTLQLEECMKRIERWGGIPRIVLADERTYKTINKEYSDLLKDPSIIKKLIDRCDTSCDLYDEDYARKAQWLTPMDVSTDFQYYRYTFPSLSIMFEVWHQVCELPKQLSFRECLREAEGGAFLGKIYEAAIRKRVSMPGPNITLNLYKLAKKLINFEVADSVELTLSFDIVSFGKNIPQSQHPTEKLFWPLSCTNESFDFIQPPYIFQITKSKSHPPIKQNGIESVMRSFETINKWFFVFVVPVDVSSELRIQKINDYEIEQFMCIVDYKHNCISSPAVCSVLNDIDFV